MMFPNTVYTKTENSQGDSGDMEKSRVQFKEPHSHSVRPGERPPAAPGCSAFMALYSVAQWLSMCGPSITWELVRNADSDAPYRSAESESRGVGGVRAQQASDAQLSLRIFAPAYPYPVAHFCVLSPCCLTQALLQPDWFPS